MTTPNNITNLKENQIFVFGSNLNGNHAGGAAKQALEWGAITGQGEGLQGQTYAFPTLGKNMEKRSVEELVASKELLYKCALENKDKIFLVTKLGCGIAGFSEEEIKEIFKGEKPENVVLPPGWSMVRGYKAFEKGLLCRGFQYEFGKDFYHKEDIVLCASGFHFCKNLGDVYSYYAYDQENTVVCEVETMGDVIDEEDGNKSVTNHIRIVRVLNPKEASNNNGINNTGHSNTGHSNTGHSNTGHSNTGHRNTGDWNTGDWNTGHSNTGHSNTGHRNTGHRNTGDWNTGHSNTGSFNTITPSEILVFNKLCNVQDWDNAEKPDCLYFTVNQWVDYCDMTDEEKRNYETSKYTGGFMRKLDYKQAFTKSLQNATQEDIEMIKKLPNFDADVFEEISGFKVK